MKLQNNNVQRDIERALKLTNKPYFTGSLHGTPLIFDDEYLIITMNGKEVKTEIERVKEVMLKAMIEVMTREINVSLGFIHLRITPYLD